MQYDDEDINDDQNVHQEDLSAIARNFPGVWRNHIVEALFEMSGVLEIEIDSLYVDLGRLPPTEQNSMVEENNDESSSESDIERDNKEGNEYTGID